MRRCSHCDKQEPYTEFSGRKTWCDGWLGDWDLRRSTPKACASLIRRFDAKVNRTDDCWLWLAAKSPAGYGVINVCGRTIYAHRVAHERWNGSLAPGIHVDHLCRERACVNPEHLEGVTPKENSRRGKNGALKKHCAQGHPWIEENIYIRPGNGHRMCRICYQERNRARSAAAAKPSTGI